LDDLRERHQETLSEDGLGYFVGVRLLLIILDELLCFFLALSDPWVVVLFNSCHEVISTDDDFFTQKTNSARVVRESDLFDLKDLGPDKSVEHAFRKGKARKGFDLARILK
jgi:hypothetical protein